MILRHMSGLFQARHKQVSMCSSSSCLAVRADVIVVKGDQIITDFKDAWKLCWTFRNLIYICAGKMEARAGGITEECGRNAADQPKHFFLYLAVSGRAKLTPHAKPFYPKLCQLQASASQQMCDSDFNEYHKDTLDSMNNPARIQSNFSLLLQNAFLLSSNTSPLPTWSQITLWQYIMLFSSKWKGLDLVKGLLGAVILLVCALSCNESIMDYGSMLSGASSIPDYVMLYQPHAFQPHAFELGPCKKCHDRGQTLDANLGHHFLEAWTWQFCAWLLDGFPINAGMWSMIRSKRARWISDKK